MCGQFGKLCRVGSGGGCGVVEAVCVARLGSCVVLVVVVVVVVVEAASCVARGGS